MVYKSGQIFLSFCHNPRVWQTDGQTDRILIARPRLHSMQRGKNQFVAVTSKQLHKFLRNRPIQQDLINAASQINAGSPMIYGDIIRAYACVR